MFSLLLNRFNTKDDSSSVLNAGGEPEESPPPPSTTSNPLITVEDTNGNGVVGGGATQESQAVAVKPKRKRAPRAKPDPLPPPNPALVTLRALITSTPPKTLHSFILSRLHPPGYPYHIINSQGAEESGEEENKRVPTFETLEGDLPTLTAFFAGLVPPPRKHCVRCHSEYVDVENGPRACVMEHDDESTTVSAGGKGLHETTWACCGQTVEGNGDLGPPAGWCFEGLHTNDVEEARYRHDADSDDDKLISCERKRCGQAKKTKRRVTRGRQSRGGVTSYAEAATDTDSASEEETSTAKPKPRSKHARKASDAISRNRSRSRLRVAQGEDVEMSDAPSVMASAKKPKSSMAILSTPAKRGRQSLPNPEIFVSGGTRYTREGSVVSTVSASGRGRGGKRGGAAGTTKPRGRPTKGVKLEEDGKEGPASKKRKLDQVA